MKRTSSWPTGRTRVPRASTASPASPVPGRGRPSWLPWAIAGGLAVLASILTFDPKLYINGDNVDYMFLARSLRGGHLWPSQKYPPLLPVLLAPVQLLFGLRLIPQKLLVLAFYAGSVWLLSRIVRRRFPLPTGPFVLFVATTLVPVVEYAHYVMSEIPYLFFLLGALDEWDRNLAGAGSKSLPKGAREPRGDGPPPPVPGSLAAVIAHLRAGSTWRLALWLAGAFYIRTAGAALGIAAVLALLLIRRPARGVALALALVGAGIPWALHALLSKGGSPYLQQLLLINPYYPEFGRLDGPALFRRLSENLDFYLAREIPATVFPLIYHSTYSAPGTGQLKLGLSLVLLLPFAGGLVRGLRRGDLAAAFVLATLVVTCLWPLIWTGSRFLVGIVPLLFLVWWEGWGVPEALGWPGIWRWIRRGLLLLLVLFAIKNLVFYQQETRRYPPVWDHYFQALDWIRDHTPKDAIVIDRKPGLVEFVTGRKALSFPREKDPDRMLDAFRAAQATHVVLSSLPYDDITRYLKPALEERRPYFNLLFRLPEPNTYVLEFRPEGGAGNVAPMGGGTGR